MEDRSSRRLPTLVTHLGLSGNENAGALISMMARNAPIRGRIH
jgi:hypothetical protein